MFNKLQAYFENKISLTQENLEVMRGLFIERHIKRGEFLQRAGEMAQYGAFVATGCLRSYTIDQKGKEHILFLLLHLAATRAAFPYFF